MLVYGLICRRRLYGLSNVVERGFRWLTGLMLGSCFVDCGRVDVGVSESDFLSEVLGW